MKRTLSVWLQLTLMVALLGTSAALWFGQKQVSEVWAAISGREAVQKQSRSKGGAAVPVVVEHVVRAQDDVTIEAIATARAKRFVTLFPEVPGEVVDFRVHAGDRVITGETLLSLDNRDAELALELAKVQVRDAERQLARSQQLLKRRVNPEARVQDARTALERSRLELKQAEEALAKRTVRAPFAGVVGIPKVETGDRISPTTAIITVDDRTELVVEVEVPEQYLTRLSSGQKMIARTPSYSDRAFEGTVDRIDSRIDPVSRTVMVRAALPNGEDLLRPGMSFAIELTIPGPTYSSVAELALQWRRGESYVWRVKDGTAEKVPVRSVKRLSSRILVDGALQEGDLVVVEGVQRLRPGRAVDYAPPGGVPGS